MNKEEMSRRALYQMGTRGKTILFFDLSAFFCLAAILTPLSAPSTSFLIWLRLSVYVLPRNSIDTWKFSEGKWSWCSFSPFYHLELCARWRPPSRSPLSTVGRTCFEFFRCLRSPFHFFAFLPSFLLFSVFHSYSSDFSSSKPFPYLFHLVHANAALPFLHFLWSISSSPLYDPHFSTVCLPSASSHFPQVWLSVSCFPTEIVFGIHSSVHDCHHLCSLFWQVPFRKCLHFPLCFADQLFSHFLYPVLLRPACQLLFLCLQGLRTSGTAVGSQSSRMKGCRGSLEEKRK